MKRKLHILAISIGIIYILFGILKFFPNFSPAESIGINTVQSLTFGLLPAKAAILALAAFELIIGVGLMTKKYLKPAIILALLHMIGTFTPLFLFPEQSFATDLMTPSLLGQYILKNLVIVSALWVIYPGPVKKDWNTSLD